MLSVQHILHLARMANRNGASSVEVQEFREAVERLVATRDTMLDALKDAEAEIACADRRSSHVLDKVRAVIAEASK